LRPVLAALVAAALLAGCADSREPSAPAPAADPAGVAEAAPPAPGAAPQHAPAPAPAEEPLERHGRTWTTACLVLQPVVGQCQHVAEGSPLTEPLPGGNPVLRFRGTLTWAGGNEVAGIGVVSGEGDDVAMVEGAYAEGPSPLAFDFDLSAAANATLGFHVASYANVGAGGANAGVSPGQEWAIAGVVTVLR
jgi:hypothetical protein